VSLDAYRGFVMLAMVSSGLALHRVAEHFPDDRAWQFLSYQLEHVPWVGCSAWDLIQPSFMFIVGVAMPYSFAARESRGDGPWARGFHVLWRALFLTFLGVFLRSNGRPQTNFTFEDVSSQIGLGYAFVYLTLGRSWRIQLGTLLAILIGYWALFAAWPIGTAELAAELGIPDDWNQLSGFAAHWNKHLNPAGAFDRWFLNLFPRPEPFRFNGGGYQTLNFIPSMATMLLGVMTGQMLRLPLGLWAKVGRLVAAGALCLALGMAVDGNIWPGLDWTWSLAPIVKRIWTPSWALFSTGWTLWTLAAFVAVIDGGRLQRWAFPLIVVGMNSIAVYVMSWLLRPWIVATIRTHFGPDVFDGVYRPMLEPASVLVILWLIAFWMYRRRIFIRV